MITDEQAEAAANFIRDNAQRYGEAKAARRYLEEYRKTQKSILMNQKKGDPQHVRESYAYAHDDYIVNLQGLKEAVEIEEKLRWQMESAKIKTEIWRTQSANNRNIDRSHR
jgi:uncharacterized membrane protein YccC